MSIEYLSLEEWIIEKQESSRRILVQDFLEEQGLRLEKSVDYTYALVLKDEVIATGSLEGAVIKCIAVAPQYKGMGVSNKIVSHLLNIAYRRGKDHLFVYTRPCNLNIFQDLGFHKIEEVPRKVILLENKSNGLKNYLTEISAEKVQREKVSAIVMNCNPFTLGHQYLVEKASAESEVLHIFLVWENQSDFPSEVRLELLKRGTRHLKNVVIHRGRDYIISSGTFPSYFLKEFNDLVATHAELDLRIFGEHIAPTLNITKRYIGEEPYCQLTATYNNTMKMILPKYGVEVVEIPRKQMGDAAISASRVRKLIKEGNIKEIKALLPATTYEYLQSEEGKRIVEKIQGS